MMRFSTRFKKFTFALVAVLALGVVISLDQSIFAQRPIAEPTVAERQGPEVAAAKRDFGDFSVAFRNLARQALPSIVSIDAMSWPTKTCEGPMLRHSVGSGFVIDPNGMILTSSQLVFGADRVRVRLRDGSEFLANSVRMDPRSNVAVVEISPIANLPALPLGNSDAMQVGDWVMALGRTSRLTPTTATGTINSVVPGPGVSRSEDFFETSAAQTLGGGGGPILNLNGEVVGIQTSSHSNWDEELERTGLVVPSNLVKWSSRQLIDNGFVNRGFFGVQTQPLSPALARQFNAPFGQGALVNRVLPNSAAAEAQIRPGDVITKIDGNPVIDSRHLQTVSEHLIPGKSYPVEIIRDGEKMNLNVTSGKVPDQMNLTPRPQRLDRAPALKPKPSSFADLGMGVKDVTADQIRQAGYREDVRGVMVESIQPNSPAAAAGLQKGMIIERIGKQNVTSVQEFNNAGSDVAINNGILLYVHTRQGPKFVAVGPDEF